MYEKYGWCMFGISIKGAVCRIGSHLLEQTLQKMEYNINIYVLKSERGIQLGAIYNLTTRWH